MSYWLLPGQEVPGGLCEDPTLNRIFTELERQFPPPTPLDRDDFDEDSE